jgi:hypothetical protein
MSSGGSRFGRDDLMNGVVIVKIMMGYGLKCLWRWLFKLEFEENCFEMVKG